MFADTSRCPTSYKIRRSRISYSHSRFATGSLSSIYSKYYYLVEVQRQASKKTSNHPLNYCIREADQYMSRNWTSLYILHENKIYLIYRDDVHCSKNCIWNPGQETRTLQSENPRNTLTFFPHLTFITITSLLLRVSIKILLSNSNTNPFTIAS